MTTLDFPPNFSSQDFISQQDLKKHHTLSVYSSLKGNMESIENNISTKKFEIIKSYVLIDNNADLTLCYLNISNSLLNCPFIGFKTFDNVLFSYNGSIAMIGISTIDENYLIDTTVFNADALLPLFKLLQDTQVLKVVFHAIPIVLSMKRDYQITIQNIIDIQLIVQILKYPCHVLSHLIEFHHEESHDTYNYRNTNLSFKYHKRPLTETILQFMMYHTQYLLPLFSILYKEIVQLQLKNHLLSMYIKSNIYTHITYESSIYDARGYLTLLQQQQQQRQKNNTYVLDTSYTNYLTENSLNKANIDPPTHYSYTHKQYKFAQLLWEWRNKVAQDNNMNIQIILPDNIFIQLIRDYPIYVQQPDQLISLLCQYTIKMHSEVVLSGYTVKLSDILDQGDMKQYVQEIYALMTEVDKEDNNAISADETAQTVSPITPSKSLSAYTTSTQIINKDIDNIHEYKVQYTLTPITHTDCHTTTTTTTSSSSSTDMVEEQNKRLWMMSPVMPPHEIYKLAGWSTPNPESSIPNNNNTTTTSHARINQASEPLKDRVKSAFTAVSTCPTPTSPYIHAINMPTSAYTTQEIHVVQDISNRVIDTSISKSRIKTHSDTQKGDEYEEDDELKSINPLICDINVTLTDNNKKISDSLLPGDETAEYMAHSRGTLLNKIPSTVEEIYELSNINRQRNKDKKKVKDSSASNSVKDSTMSSGGDVDDAVTDEDSSPNSIAKGGSTTVDRVPTREQTAVDMSDGIYSYMDILQVTHPSDPGSVGSTASTHVHSSQQTLPPLYPSDLEPVKSLQSAVSTSAVMNDMNKSSPREYDSFDIKSYFKIKTETINDTITHTLDIVEKLGWITTPEIKNSLIQEAILNQNNTNNNNPNTTSTTNTAITGNNIGSSNMNTISVSGPNTYVSNISGSNNSRIQGHSTANTTATMTHHHHHPSSHYTNKNSQSVRNSFDSLDLTYNQNTYTNIPLKVSSSPDTHHSQRKHHHHSQHATTMNTSGGNNSNNNNGNNLHNSGGRDMYNITSNYTQQSQGYTSTIMDNPISRSMDIHGSPAISSSGRSIYSDDGVSASGAGRRNKHSADNHHTSQSNLVNNFSEFTSLPPAEASHTYHNPYYTSSSTSQPYSGSAGNSTTISPEIQYYSSHQHNQQQQHHHHISPNNMMYSIHTSSAHGNRTNTSHNQQSYYQGNTSNQHYSTQHKPKY